VTAGISVYDIPAIGEKEVRERSQATLARFPALRHLYDDAFLSRLARKRQMDNYLLWLLIQNPDEYADSFWATVIDDLDLLGPEGSWEAFMAKFRHRERLELQSACSELGLTAWMKRRGPAVQIEPPTRSGRTCDFSAETNPFTWWEIKTVQDADFLVTDELIAREVQLRLRHIDQPYVLIMEPSSVERNEVAVVVRNLRRQLAEYHVAGGPLPHLFESHGLRVVASALTTRSRGYLGIVEGRPHLFGDELAMRVVDRIVGAMEQLPDDSAGIVVIDTTLSTWIEDEDIADACFGVEGLGYVNGKLISVRRNDLAAFRPNERTRISAVAHYSRSARETTAPYEIIVNHNPCAKHKLPDGLLRGKHVKQRRMRRRSDGLCRLEEF